MFRYGQHAEADIVFLQNTLNSVRRNYTSIRHIESIGGFGSATFGAVVDFQLRVGLPTTGIVNEETWYRLMYVFENPPQTPDPAFEPIVNARYFTLVNLNLRSAPSMSGESLAIKPQGASVWVWYYISNDSWFFVETDEGQTGYMKAEFLMREGILP